MDQPYGSNENGGIGVSPQNISIKRFRFRSWKNGEWTSSHLQEGVVRYPEESLVVTGDGNLVEVFLTIRYHYGDLAQAELLGIADPGFVRMRAEATLRKILGSQKSEDLLGKSRADLSDWLARKFAKFGMLANLPTRHKARGPVFLLSRMWRSMICIHPERWFNRIIRWQRLWRMVRNGSVMPRLWF